MSVKFKYNKVLLTGGAGFIGANLCRKLLNLGVSVCCVDNLRTGKIENIKELLDCKSFHFIDLDIKNFDGYCVPSDIDVIMNFACVASPKAYYANPIDTLLTSVLGVSNLLNFATLKKIPFLQALTSEVYGDPTFDILEESYCGNVSCVGPRTCYDEGKRAAETLCMDFHRIYGLETKIIRIFNTYGPYMDTHDGRAIPEFINCSLNNDDIIIFGDGAQTRSFMFVDDLINGIVEIMNSNIDNFTPINIGNPNEEHTIEYIAKTIIEAVGSKSRIVYKEKLTDDPRKRKPDITKITKETQWKPAISLEEGLKRTIEYFKNK